MKKIILLTLLTLIINLASAENESTYSKEYLCNKSDEFIKNNAQDYKIENIALLQEEVRWEKNIIIPIATLENYIKNNGEICHKQVTTEIAPQKTKSFNMGLYLKLPIDPINLGQWEQNEDSNAKGIFSLINLFFPLTISDELSEKPNVTWEWTFRVIPLGLFVLAIIIIVYIQNKLKKTNDSIDQLIRDYSRG